MLKFMYRRQNWDQVCQWLTKNFFGSSSFDIKKNVIKLKFVYNCNQILWHKNNKIGTRKWWNILKSEAEEASVIFYDCDY